MGNSFSIPTPYIYRTWNTPLSTYAVIVPISQFKYMHTNIILWRAQYSNYGVLTSVISSPSCLKLCKDPQGERRDTVTGDCILLQNSSFFLVYSEVKLSFLKLKTYDRIGSLFVHFLMWSALIGEDCKVCRRETISTGILFIGTCGSGKRLSVH